MSGFDEIVFFGDSNTDGGAGAHGIYELSGHANPPSPPYYRGQWCNGPVWAERFAQKLGVSYIPSLNFAVGGANTGTTNVGDAGWELLRGTGMLSQVQRYVAGNPSIDTGALCVLWAGGNNFSDPRIPGDEVVVRALQDIEQGVELLSDAGARLILVVTNPNEGRAPGARAQGMAQTFDQLSRDLDTGVMEMVRRLRTRLSADIALGEAFALHEKVVAEPQRYGFTNVTDPCLLGRGEVRGDPSEYLYWDGGHFTAAFHALVADELYDAVSQHLG